MEMSDIDLLKMPKIGVTTMGLTTLDVLIDNDHFRVLRDNDLFYLDTTSPRKLRGEIIQLLDNHMDYSSVRGFGGYYPFSTLLSCLSDNDFNFLDDFGPDEDDQETKSSSLKKDCKVLRSLLLAVRLEMARTFEIRKNEGNVLFDDLTSLFKVGDCVTSRAGIRDAVAGTVLKMAFKSSWTHGRYFEMELEVISPAGGKISRSKIKAIVWAWSGIGKIAELSYVHLSDSVREALIERGRKFVKYGSTATYCFVNGPIEINSWWNSKELRATGRVMIDNWSMKNCADQPYNASCRKHSIEDNDDDETSDSGKDGSSLVISDDILWKCMPILFGFSMVTKKWGVFKVEDLSDVQWRDDAFQRLVMPDAQKRMIMSLVQYHGQGFTDVIEGKGGGLIFLLHGEPGQGKTLTAETVAEQLRRPLHSVSVGELGTDVETLENKLSDLLELGSRWNSVMLLDEADIFLEKRDSSDIVRNAMVGVFLRMLEYYNGVLFLTTNRVSEIDPAFISRISMGIRFGKADHEKRMKVWTNILQAAGILDYVSFPQIESMAKYDINGRQIKNVIRNAQTMGIADGSGNERIADHINTVIRETLSFVQEVSEAQAE